MDKIKFTGTNIAAAILVLFYFFPWVDMTIVSMSGASITSKGLSPGPLSYFISGFSRFYLILAILVPLSGALILYQNITGNLKFSKYFKLAHIIPVVYFIVGIIGLYFKMKPDVPAGMEDMYNNMSSELRNMAPGVTDVLAFGLYLSLIASIYLLLVAFGKIKDKEYYKPAVGVGGATGAGSAPGVSNVENNIVDKNIPPAPDTKVGE